MFEFLLRPLFSTFSSASSTSSSSQCSGPRRASSPSILPYPGGPPLSSSCHHEIRTASTVIIQRNLVTDFLEATSLPVNVPIHRSREAASPGTPMRTELSRCEKELPPRLARRLSLPHTVSSSPLLGARGAGEEAELVFRLEIVVE
jgi:hypothetical protein